MEGPPRSSAGNLNISFLLKLSSILHLRQSWTRRPSTWHGVGHACVVTLHGALKTKTMTVILFLFVILAFALFYKCIEWFEKI